MDIAQRLRLAFDAECREHLAAMRRLARRGAGAPDIADVFRRAHSLKGAARAVDRQGIETVAHRLESLLEHIQRGGLILDGAVERVIQTALDGIEDLAGGPDEAAMPLPVVAELDVLLAGTTQAGAPPPAVPEFAAAPAVPPPGSAPLDEPAVAAVEPARPVPTASPAPVHATVRVAAEHLDRLMVTSGRFLAQVTAQNELALQLRTLQQQLAALQRDWERARLAGRRHDGASGGADSLQAETQLAAIDKEISALVRGATQIVRDQKAATWQLRLLVDQLQDDVRQARLVPAEEIFSGFGPMVRELAREQNKQIVLTLMGLEIEADRMILQALKDPVMHALRNAIGHGAEPAQARVAAGKPPAARVALSLTVEGTRLRLVIEDDGRGLDFARIRAKAVQDGLLDDAAETATEAELANLLLRAGFSTATAVDSLSGRGIGLSVLQETVARLQGDVDISANRPYGMRLVIHVPMSVVRSDLLLVRSAGQLYALPAHAIERVLRIHATALETVEGKPVLRLGDDALPMVALLTLLGTSDAALTDPDGNCAIVVLRSGRRRLAVVVDSLVEMRQAAIQSPPAGTDPAIAGTLLLQGGAPILVLSPHVLVAQRGTASTAALILAGASAQKEPPCILVVDDSITTRTLEKSILEAEGFRVRLAVDGLDALDSLRREPVDLVISDVQMPRLDGFGLLQAIKADPAFASIPVIMVTSRDSAEEVKRGMELGADAYIAKQRFEQQELLATIGQFLDGP